ncbi:DUF134 domain-containing protein [uncultured Selenomonas sp.]|uniref:DUF134 domain-containing protein n=1 Tax=uncultured Selenomonas sp. TaxID=159275 RepID=UPI0028DB1E2B|nr:DUF134 domain-containing protein [uncultured Selenomonas sp.]
MPRPTRGRRICVHPAYERFTPAGFPGGEAVVLLVEEYECIRSIDHDGLKQEECARRMAISRTTVAEIYAAARRKIAESLVHGRPLVIQGGCYQLCDMSAPCGKCCPRAKAQQDYRFSPPREKGTDTMRIAIPYETETGTIYQHFGHAKAFKLYDVQDGAVEKSEEISAQGSGHGALADLLEENHVDALICGGIGAGAIEALKNAAILVCAGVKGAADEAVAQHLAGTLDYTTQANCSHHGTGHGHAEGPHRCSHAHDHGEDAPRCSHAHSHGHGRGGEGGHRCPHAHGGSGEQQE